VAETYFIEKDLGVAIGDPLAGPVEIKHFRPVGIDLYLARLGEAPEPLVGPSDLE